MALFKIFKGNQTNKLTDSTVEGYRIPTDGYAYYDTSTKKFYIDADYDNNGTITRQPINANHSDSATLAQAAVYETTNEVNASLNPIRSYYAHNLSRVNDDIQLLDGDGKALGDIVNISDKQNKNFIVKFYDRIYDSDYIEGESSRYQANFNLQDFRNATLQNFGDCELQAQISDIDNRYIYTNYYMLTVIFYAVHVFYSIDVALEGLNLNSINGVNYRYFAFADTGGNTIPDNNIFRGQIFVPSEETIENYLQQELENYITQESLEEYLSNYPTWDDLDTTIGDYLPLSGGTMTGNLILNANPSLNMQAANKQYVDTGLSTKLNINDTAYRTVSIPMGQVDNTSTATAFTATISGITELRDGVCILLKNGVITSASGCTLNINNLGAKPIYQTMAAESAVTTTFNKAYTMLFIYNSSRISGGCWDMYYGYYANTNTLLRTYASSSANELPLVGVSNSTSMGIPSHTSSYKDLYGGIPATKANRPTVQLSTGLVKVPGGIQGNLTGNVTGNLTGNASSATGFASAKAISLTGNITGSGSGGNGNNGWTISTTIPAGTITNEMLAGSIANAKLINHAINVAGTDVELGGSITAATLKSNLGLDSAMHFIGVSSTAVTDGGNENPTISGYSTKTAGDVILYGNQEFIYTKENKWELFGDEGSYKVKQTAIADSDATTVTGENDTFVTSVIQNANGVISVSKQLVKNEIYLVNVTMSSITEGTSDKSSTQIAEALQAGKLPVVKTGYGNMAMMAQLSNLAYDEDEDAYYASFEYNDQFSVRTENNGYATKATMVITGTAVIVEIHSGSYLTTSELPDFLYNAGYLTSYTETDPTVPAWAKQATKPTYNLAEINNAEDVNAIEELSDNETGFLKKTGQNTWILDNSTYVTNAGVTKITTTAGSHTALSNATGAVSFKVPTNTSHLTNDSGFIGVTEATNTATALINNLDVSNISGFGKGKTLKTLTETDGKIAATFQDIEIAKSQISDFPSSMPASDVYSWAKQESKPVYNLGEITQASDIQAIEALTGTTGFLKKTAANTWTLDTNTYVTDAGVTTITTTAGAHTTISSKKGAVSFNVPTKTSHLTNDNNFITITEVTNAINNLDVSNISGFGANKTLATLSETNGKISATFQNISITKSQVSDFPTNVSAFNNDSEYITAEDLPTWVTPAKPVYNLGEITQAEDVQAIEALTDTAGLLRKTAANTWSLDTNIYATTSYVTTQLSNYLPLTGGEVTGDITLKAPANSDSPSLIFQRGTLSDTYNDWRLIDNGGILRFQERVSGSTAWASQVSIQTSGITANNVTATNNMYATTYKVNNKATIQYNSTTDALEFVFAS